MSKRTLRVFEDDGKIYGETKLTMEIVPEKDAKHTVIAMGLVNIQKLFTENLLALVPAKDRKAAKTQLDALLEVAPFTHFGFTESPLTYDANGNVKGLGPDFEPATLPAKNP